MWKRFYLESFRTTDAFKWNEVHVSIVEVESERHCCGVAKAGMLERLGFKKVGMIPQWFGGETVMKTVMVNEATTESVLSHVLVHGTDKSLIVIYMSTPEMYSADYIADEIKGDDMMQNEFFEIIQNYDDYRSFIPLARIISVMSEISRYMRRTEFFKNCVEVMDKVFSSNFQWKKFKSRYRL